MMKYMIKNLIKYTKLIVIVFFVFLLSKSSYEKTSFTVAINDNLNKVLEFDVIEESQDNLYEKSIYSPIYTFTGDLTGYSGDCPLCTGYLACPPRTNVVKYGIFYNDKVYGKLRIVASSKKYPCGTIIRFNVDKLSDEPIIAIILDRGVPGNDIDLLTESGEYATVKVGRVRNQKFEVLRQGWSEYE